MVRTSSHGLSAFLESCLEKARQAPGEKEERWVTGDAAPRKKNAPTPPPLRPSGFFGSGM